MTHSNVKSKSRWDQIQSLNNNPTLCWAMQVLSLHRQAPGLQASSAAMLLVRTEVNRITIRGADIAAEYFAIEDQVNS